MSKILDLIHPGDLIYDCGAHIGTKTQNYLDCGADVVCFEPQPRIFALLSMRFGSDPRVTLVNKALGATPGRLPLSIGAATTISTMADHWKRGRFREHSWPEVVEVPVTTLDLAMEEYGVPDFLKIDVEGYEMEVLLGLSAKVDCLSFEFAKEYLSDAGEIIDRLAEQGYKEFAIGWAEGEDISPWRSGLDTFTALYDGTGWTGAKDDEWGDVYAR